MRVLLIEDEERWQQLIEKEIERVAPNTVLVAARSLEAASQALESGPYDVAVCDLRIPFRDDSSEPDKAHGLAVYARIQEQHPYLPTIILTGFPDVEEMREFINIARQADPFGEGSRRPMLRFIPKTSVDECIDELGAIAEELTTLDDLEVSVGATGPTLTESTRRAIRIFTRRRGGVLVRVRKFPGGMSGAMTLNLEMEDERGAIRSRLVAKVGARQDILKELASYEEFVAPMLPAGCYAGRVDEVIEGAWDTGALFYGFAERFDRNLFQLLAADPELAAVAIQSLHQCLDVWSNGVPATGLTVGTITEMLLPRDLRTKALSKVRSFSWDEVEARHVQARVCPTHGDLHGANVLVAEDGNAMLIDFGAVGEAPRSIDPITLEMSVLVHPLAASLRKEWPTIEHCRSWGDLERYLEGCPYPDYVRACRRWACEQSNHEAAASAYAYTLRALAHDRLTPEMAEGLLGGISSALQ